MEMADRIAEDGFKDVGYEFVNIDVSQSLATNNIWLLSAPCFSLVYPGSSPHFSVWGGASVRGYLV